VVDSDNNHQKTFVPVELQKMNPARMAQQWCKTEIRHRIFFEKPTLSVGHLCAWHNFCSYLVANFILRFLPIGGHNSFLYLVTNFFLPRIFLQQHLLLGKT
jgi:hypothetical protein